MYVCMCVCIYIYMRLHMCGWLCTLYDRLSWLHEGPSLTTSTPDLVVWVCAQGICCRCIFMLYSVHGHHGVIAPIHVTWVTLVSPCMWCTLTCLMLWRASACQGTSMLIHIIYTSVRPYWCTIAHQMQNSSGFSPWKWGTSITVFSQRWE